ncbi:MAG: GIY-YIG nuclease family protein [Candidatus Tagabacteria bacterium]
MHGVYVLRSKKDSSLYFGYSTDIKKRVNEHQKGQVLSTRDKRPLEIIYCELYKNKKDAMRREKFFKSGWGRNYIKKILRDTLKE